MDLMTFEKINRLNNPYTDLGLEVLDKIITNEFKNAELDLRRRDQELRALELSHRMDEARRNYDLSIKNKIAEEKYKDMLYKMRNLELQNAQDEIEAQNFLLEKNAKTFSDAKMADGFEALSPGVKAIINKNAMRENAQIKTEQMQNRYVYGLMENVIKNPEILALTKGNPSTFFEAFNTDPEFAKKVILIDRNQRFTEIAAKNNVAIDEIQDLLDNPDTSDAQFWSRMQKLKESKKAEQLTDYKNLLEQPVSYEDASGIKNTTASKLLADYFYVIQSENKEAKEGVERAILARPDVFIPLTSVYPQLANVFKQPETQTQESDKTSVSIQGEKLGETGVIGNPWVTTPYLMFLGDTNLQKPVMPSIGENKSLKIGDIDVSSSLNVKEKIPDLPIDEKGILNFNKIKPYQKYKHNGKTVQFTEDDLEVYSYYYNKYKKEGTPIDKKTEFVYPKIDHSILEIPIDKDGYVDFDKVKPFQRYKHGDNLTRFTPEEIATYKMSFRGRVAKLKPEQVVKNK